MTLKDHLPDIIARRQRGETCRHIAEVYDVAPSYISQLAPFTGKPDARKDVELIAEIRVFWDEGFSITDIAAALTTEKRPLTGNAVIGIVRRENFPLRRPERSDKRWTERDLNTLWRRRQRNERFETIAPDINRSLQAVRARYRRLREEHGFDLS